MAKRGKRALRLIATGAVLVPVAAIVIYTSLQVSEYECEVCVSFRGRDVCRTVTASNEEEGVRSATDNACALLVSGVTDTLRCTRARPLRAVCRKLGEDTTSEASRS